MLHTNLASWISPEVVTYVNAFSNLATLWFQLEDMFQLISLSQAIEQVAVQLKDTPTKVYAIDARLFLSKVPLEQACFFTRFAAIQDNGISFIMSLEKNPWV